MMVRIFRFGIALLLFTAVYSCENKLEVIEAVTDVNTMPDGASYDVESLRSDSGKIQMRMTTPEVLQYSTVTKPYEEFPKGMHVYLYNDSMEVKAEVSALYVKHLVKEDLWEARKNVVVVNIQGDRLNTEELFWDPRKHIIYSSKYCRITRKDGSEHISTCGLEAKEDFTDYKLLCPDWGTLVFKDAQAQ